MSVKFEDMPIEYYILDEMVKNKAPLGAGYLKEILNAKSIMISEAGIGRILRSMRLNGYLERVGYQGHKISEIGTKKLSELNNTFKIKESILNLINNTGSIQGYKFHEILVARRAIEKESAFMAALNATDEDIIHLEEIIKLQNENKEKAGTYSDLSFSFHLEIVKASHVSLLMHLYEFIGLSLQWQKDFIGAFNKLYNKPLTVTHEMIFNAIKRHQAEEASNLIARHLIYTFDNDLKVYYKN